MEKNKIALFALPILVLFLISIASAETLVGGKIYNSNFDNPTSDASVTVECTHNEEINTKYTSSVGDGTYAIKFNETECVEGDSVKVTANKGDFSGDSHGIINKCNGNEECDTNFFAIINTLMKQATSNTGGNTNGGGGSSGGGGGFICTPEWECTEWGDCVNSLHARTCEDIKKCHTTKNKPETSRTCIVSVEESSTTEIQESEETQQTAFSKITGAVIGTLGPTRSIVVIVFLVGIIGSAITVGIIRKRKLR